VEGLGLFIVLEGGDGVGKTTQAALLSSWMEGAGIPHVVTREPGGTPVGEAIRGLVLDRDDLDLSRETELLLILAARAAFVRDVVRPALAAGTTVVSDRFTLSTLAYQGFGRGIDLGKVRAGIEIATGGLEPDLCFVLDLPQDEIMGRMQRTGAVPDRIEREGEAFRHAVREGYLALAESEGNVQVIDARGTPEEVHERLRARVAARLSKARRAAR
jgi:dTMP kinase